MSENDHSVADFVAQTLQQIVAGINRAQGKPDASTDLIVPRFVEGDGKGNTIDKYSGRMVHLVSFDLLVEATNAKTIDGKASAGIDIHLVKAGAGASRTSEEAAASSQRVRFNVPVLWPSHDGSPSEEDYRKMRAEDAKGRVAQQQANSERLSSQIQRRTR